MAADATILEPESVVMTIFDDTTLFGVATIFDDTIKFGDRTLSSMCGQSFACGAKTEVGGG